MDSHCPLPYRDKTVDDANQSNYLHVGGPTGHSVLLAGIHCLKMWRWIPLTFLDSYFSPTAFALRPSAIVKDLGHSAFWKVPPQLFSAFVSSLDGSKLREGSTHLTTHRPPAVRKGDLRLGYPFRWRHCDFQHQRLFLVPQGKRVVLVSGSSLAL